MKAGSPSHFLIRSFWKDMRYTFFPMMRGVLGPLVVIFVIILGFANAFAFSEEKLTSRHEPEDEVPSEFFFIDVNEDTYEDAGEGDSIYDIEERYLLIGKGATGFSFGVLIAFYLPLFLILIGIHSAILTKEIQSGNIRSFFHYSVSVRKLLGSKMINTLAILAILTIFISYMIATALIVWDLPFWIILLAIIFNFIFMAGQYVFFFSLTNLFQRSSLKLLKADPLPIVVLGNMILLGITETGLYAFYSALADMFRWSNDYPWFLIFKYLSPFHTYGVIIDSFIYGSNLRILDFLWVPIFIGVIFASVLIKKKAYPDIFIHETA